MTERSGPPGHVGSLPQLPDLSPRTGSGTPNAQPSTRAREASSRPTRQASSDAASRSGLPGWLTGFLLVTEFVMLWNTAPPSLAETWQMHSRSARYFEAGWIRYPRYAWGCFHAALGAVLLFTVWALQTVPRALLFAAAIALTVWLL